jgi:hypothetical protein
MLRLSIASTSAVNRSMNTSGMFLRAQLCSQTLERHHSCRQSPEARRQPCPLLAIKAEIFCSSTCETSSIPSGMLHRTYGQETICLAFDGDDKHPSGTTTAALSLRPQCSMFRCFYTHWGLTRTHIASPQPGQVSRRGEKHGNYLILVCVFVQQTMVTAPSSCRLLASAVS